MLLPVAHALIDETWPYICTTAEHGEQAHRGWELTETYDYPVHLELVTKKTCATEEIEHVGNEERMKHWSRQLNVPKVTRTGEVREFTCCAAAKWSVNVERVTELLDTHVLLVEWAQSRIVESSDCWPSQIVEEDGIHDLLY